VYELKSCSRIIADNINTERWDFVSGLVCLYIRSEEHKIPHGQQTFKYVSRMEKGVVFEFHKESANAASNGKINGGWS